jgi:serine/threonine protein kinase
VIGRQIAHYYLIRTLGTGGMGVVDEAQDTRLPRSVAVKVLREELAKKVEAVRRFKREARLASSLNHPNICTILEVSDDESQAYIAMELLEGRSLKSRLLGGPLWQPAVRSELRLRHPRARPLLPCALDARRSGRGSGARRRVGTAGAVLPRHSWPVLR